MQNRKQAQSLDKAFYADCEDGCWYVFGDNSGFAYHECRNQEEANKMADEMTKALASRANKKICKAR